MAKRPVKIEVVEEGDERFLLEVYSDGRKKRTPISKGEEEESLVFQSCLVLGFKDRPPKILLSARVEQAVRCSPRFRD